MLTLLLLMKGGNVMHWALHLLLLALAGLVALVLDSFLGTSSWLKSIAASTGL